MALFRYLSHPEVVVDPATPVPEWSISDLGRTRVAAGLREPWSSDITRVVSSPEVKALETADMVAAHGEVDVAVRERTGEIDRSSTGYVPHERHEELANQLFANPTASAQGWERAVDAQARIVEAVADLTHSVVLEHHIVAVGHGGVGTLLMCWLAQWPIDRCHDQPRGGCHWAYDTNEQRLVHAWMPLGG